MTECARKYEISKLKLSINKKINYRNMVLTVIKLNGWSKSDIDNHFKILALKDPQGMAKTWLKKSSLRTYEQEYFRVLRKNFMI
jgi:hypothetical protein